MGALKRKHLITWLVIMAYVLLLAHVFVPHHHHDDQTAFINLTCCPHDHQHPHGENTGHEPCADRHTASCSGSVQCETLKHTLLKNSVLDLPDFKVSGFPLFDIISVPSLEKTNCLPIEEYSNSPHSLHYLSEYHLCSWSHRGPPFLS